MRSMLAFVCGLGSVLAQAPSDAMACFKKLSPPAQEEVVGALRKDLQASDSPLLVSLFACVREAESPAVERSKRLAVRKPSRKMPSAEKPDVVIPPRVRYVFGVGAIEPVDASPSGKVTDAVRAAMFAREREVVMQHALRGMVPGADEALAALLRRLDHDTTGDEFAAFLHAWRNGDESFYEALDRTAGTKDAVFFYDAMLNDFSGLFVPKTHPDAARLNRSLQALHDALHEAFLQYRRYRSFREAVAYSLVLPPAVALPSRLQRFERAPKGLYSLRDQVLMVRELHNGDARAAADAIVVAAVPLPDPLWKATEDPIAAWSRAFAALVPKMIEAAGDTDTLLARARTNANEAASAVRAAADKALAAAPRPPAR